MKRSTALRLAMIAVADSNLNAGTKVDVIKVLIDDEKIALWTEEQEEKKNG